MVGFTRRFLYSRGKSAQYPMDRRLDVPQRQFGRGGEARKTLPLT